MLLRRHHTVTERLYNQIYIAKPVFYSFTESFTIAKIARVEKGLRTKLKKKIDAELTEVQTQLQTTITADNLDDLADNAAASYSILERFQTKFDELSQIISASLDQKGDDELESENTYVVDTISRISSALGRLSGFRDKIQRFEAKAQC